MEMKNSVLAVMLLIVGLIVGAEVRGIMTINNGGKRSE